MTALEPGAPDAGLLSLCGFVWELRETPLVLKACLCAFGEAVSIRHSARSSTFQVIYSGTRQSGIVSPCRRREVQSCILLNWRAPHSGGLSSVTSNRILYLALKTTHSAGI